MPNLDPPRTPDIPPDVLPLRARQWRIPKSLSALQHPNFRLYVWGQLVSLMGTWMQNIGQGWLVYQLSHSELALGIVGFASAIPALVITPWGGVLVDRVNKRNLLAWTQVGAMLLAFILAGLTFAGVVQVWHVVLLAVGLGVVNALDGPARQAFVVEMVGREDLPNAIALNSITFNSARIIGPAIGGLLLVAFGAGWCFLFNGLSFLAVIASLFTMRLPAYVAKPAKLSPWQQLKSGVAYAIRTPELRALLLLALVFSLFGISYATIMPAFVDKALQRGGSAYGVVNAMSGVGAVVGGFSGGPLWGLRLSRQVAGLGVVDLSGDADPFLAQPQLPVGTGAGRGAGRRLYDHLYPDQYAVANPAGRRDARAGTQPLHADLFWLYPLWQPGHRHIGRKLGHPPSHDPQRGLFVAFYRPGLLVRASGAPLAVASYFLEQKTRKINHKATKDTKKAQRRTPK